MGEALRIDNSCPGGEKIATSNSGVQDLGCNLRVVCLLKLENLEPLILFVDNRRHGALMSHRPDDQGDPLCKRCQEPEERNKRIWMLTRYIPSPDVWLKPLLSVAPPSGIAGSPSFTPLVISLLEILSNLHVCYLQIVFCRYLVIQSNPTVPDHAVSDPLLSGTKIP